MVRLFSKKLDRNKLHLNLRYKTCFHSLPVTTDADKKHGALFVPQKEWMGQHLRKERSHLGIKYKLTEL